MKNQNILKMVSSSSSSTVITMSSVMTCAGFQNQIRKRRRGNFLSAGALTSLAAAMDYQNGLSKRIHYKISGTYNNNVPLSWLIKNSMPYNSM